MWFTIAFFTYPFALFLIYKGIKNYKTNGLRNLFFSILIFVFPIILLLVEQRNLDEIKSDLIGNYVSNGDTLIIHKSKYVFRSKGVQTFGIWELITDDNLGIRLTNKQNKNVELRINYSDGQPILKNEVKTYTKIKQ